MQSEVQMTARVVPPERSAELDAAFNATVLASVARLKAVVEGAAGEPDPYRDQIATNFVNFAFTVVDEDA